MSIAIAVSISSALTYAISLHPPDKRPEKVARLVFIAGFLASYLILWRKSRPALSVAAALPNGRRQFRTIASGFAAGAGTLAAFLCVSVLVGWWRPLPEAESWLKILGRAAFYLPAGLFLAIWEEGLFRGVIFGDIERSSGPRTALVVSCLLFSWSHLLGPLPGTAVEWTSSNVGIEAVTANFVGIAKVTTEWPKLLGLTLVAYVLTRLRMRTGTAWLGVGVHAGWYYVQQMDGRFLRFAVKEGDPVRYLSGTQEYADGLAGFIALWITYLIARRFLPDVPKENHA